MLSLKVLIVDDMPEVRKLLMETLRFCRLARFEFVEAGDGQSALDGYDTDRVDLCFVDWNMPKMNGIEFVRNARMRERGGKRIPMIMVTGEHAVGKIDEALDAAGADAYLCKPFSLRDLKLKVGRIVDKLELASSPPPAPGGFMSWLMN